MGNNENNLSDSIKVLLDKIETAKLDLVMLKWLLYSNWKWDFLMNTTELWYINDILDLLSKQIAWLRKPS